MARYPGASYRPLGAQTEPRMSRYDIVCVHTMVGYLKSTDTMFKRNGYNGTESHFGVGGTWGSDGPAGLDGRVYQWQDTTHQADANGPDGNHRVISIETADNAPGTVEAIAEWTPKQVRSIAAVIAWVCKTHGIPAVLVPDSKPGRRGVAYHRQGCRHSQGLDVPGYLVTGGERWSTAVGKGCPGPRRVSQLRDEVMPLVKSILNPPPAPTPPAEDTVSSEEARIGTIKAFDTERPLMTYLTALYNETDNAMTLFQLAQHAAGQSRAALLNTENLAETTAATSDRLRVIEERLGDLQGTVEAILSVLSAKPPVQP